METLRAHVHEQEQRTARVGKVLESLAVESQDGVIPWHAPPMEDFMERSHLLRSQPHELSVMPVQNKPKS